MDDTIGQIRQQGLIAVVDAPVEDHLFDWGMAAAKGGIQLLGIPAWLPNVAEVTSDLGDEAGLTVGVSGVISSEHISTAMAAGAEFVICPISDPEVISGAKSRGLAVLAGASTPTEIVQAAKAGADMVMLYPIGALGGASYMSLLIRQFPNIPLIAAGAVDVERAPTYLEAGATAAVVDRGVFPDSNEPAALEVITARAMALTEVCAEVVGSEKRISMSGLLRL